MRNRVNRPEIPHSLFFFRRSAYRFERGHCVDGFAHYYWCGGGGWHWRGTMVQGHHFDAHRYHQHQQQAGK